MTPTAGHPATFSLSGVVLGLAIMLAATFALMLVVSLLVCAILYGLRQGRFRVIRRDTEVYPLPPISGSFAPMPPLAPSGCLGDAANG